jgi:hypothetical protein
VEVALPWCPTLSTAAPNRSPWRATSCVLHGLGRVAEEEGGERAELEAEHDAIIVRVPRRQARANG